jgi:hypothetical protein
MVCKYDKMEERDDCTLDIKLYYYPTQMGTLYVNPKGEVRYVSLSALTLLRVRVDNNEQRGEVYAVKCEYTCTLPEDLIVELLRGTKMKVETISLSGTVGPIDVDLTGFEELYKQMRIKSPPKKPKPQRHEI